VDQYLEKYVYGVTEFEEYLKLTGGKDKLDLLTRQEFLRAPLKVPWAEEAS
jgi:hypothetical protein